MTCMKLWGFSFFFTDNSQTRQENVCMYKRYLEARSLNQCCRYKVTSVANSGCVFLALIIQHSKRKSRVMLSSAACLILPCFSHIS